MAPVSWSWITSDSTWGLCCCAGSCTGLDDDELLAWRDTFGIGSDSWYVLEAATGGAGRWGIIADAELESALTGRIPWSVLTILITPALGACFGVVGRGGLIGGPGLAGGDFGRHGGAFGIPRLLKSPTETRKKNTHKSRSSDFH